MNKLLFIKYYLLIILVIILTGNDVFSQSISPKLSPTIVKDQNDSIQDLKEKVANKVAEIRKKNNKATVGRVESISDNSFKIRTSNQSEFEVKLQESGLTKFFTISGNQHKEIDKENINEGDYIIVTGVVIDKTITANSVFVDQQYLTGSGKISELDSDKYLVKVLSSDKTAYSLSIETYTKQRMINIKTLDVEKIGFSKIKEGDSIHFVVKLNGSEKNNEYSAEKILIIPQEYFMK